MAVQKNKTAEVGCAQAGASQNAFGPGAQRRVLIPKGKGMALELADVRNSKILVSKDGCVPWDCLLNEGNDARIDLPSASVADRAESRNVAISVYDGFDV